MRRRGKKSRENVLRRCERMKFACPNFSKKVMKKDRPARARKISNGQRGKEGVQLKKPWREKDHTQSKLSRREISINLDLLPQKPKGDEADPKAQKSKSKSSKKTEKRNKVSHREQKKEAN